MTEVIRNPNGTFGPGSVANPGGRPVKLATSIRRAILACSDRPIPDCLRTGAIATLPEDATMLEAVTMAAMEQACKGNMSAFLAVRDSIDGPISARVDVQHSLGNNPIASLTGQALLDATLALLQGRTPMSVAEIVDVEASRVVGGDESEGGGVRSA